MKEEAEQVALSSEKLYCGEDSCSDDNIELEVIEYFLKEKKFLFFKWKTSKVKGVKWECPNCYGIWLEDVSEAV